mmetsp:Transcript_3999/g.12029  ORF Transcript_3999/g.12029 Transcript_3999/m.12029 type:complete len:207 (+) Transcript_3999:197-817(+)
MREARPRVLDDPKEHLGIAFLRAQVPRFGLPDLPQKQIKVGELRDFSGKVLVVALLLLVHLRRRGGRRAGLGTLRPTREGHGSLLHEFLKLAVRLAHHQLPLDVPRSRVLGEHRKSVSNLFGLGLKLVSILGQGIDRTGEGPWAENQQCVHGIFHELVEKVKATSGLVAGTGTGVAAASVTRGPGPGGCPPPRRDEGGRGRGRRAP